MKTNGVAAEKYDGKKVAPLKPKATEPASAKTSPAKSAVVKTSRGTRNKAGNGQAQERQRLIAERAYFYAEQRGFEPGDEMSDWFRAEADVERMLTGC